jgi:hypothetical protein
MAAASDEDAPTLVCWQTIARDANGLVNFGELFPGTDSFSAYAQLRVYSLDKQPVEVLVGSSGPVRLWLNGKQVHEKTASGPAAPAQDTVPVTLEVGWNTLLARVLPGKDGQVLYLRLSGEPAQPALTMIELLERELQRRKLKLGPDHPDTLSTRGLLGRLYETAGRYNRQEPLLRDFLAEMQNQNGPKSVEAGGAMAS